MKNKITSFDKDIIIQSLLENKPILFWYLWKNKLWDLNTQPIVWQTKNNKKIYGYVWEHTWVIIGVSLYNNWEISRIYFYEWKSQDMQDFSYYDIHYQASFFDMMIIAN